MVYEYLAKEDIYLIQAELPEEVHGFCKECGCYRFAVIGASLEDEEKLEAAMHEIEHLKNGDLDKNYDELSVL